jgi:hypothetical protein
MRAADTGSHKPLLDLASYGRPGPARRDTLTPVEVAQIGRTLTRHPEVMVKVLTHGARDAHGVGRHLDYIGRQGDVELLADDGSRLQGADAASDLVSDWDLEREEIRRRPALEAREFTWR